MVKTWQANVWHPDHLRAVEGQLPPGFEPGVEALEGCFRVLQVGYARRAQDVVKCAQWELCGLSILPDPGYVQELLAVPLGDSLWQDTRRWDPPCISLAMCSMCTA